MVNYVNLAFNKSKKWSIRYVTRNLLVPTLKYYLNANMPDKVNDFCNSLGYEHLIVTYEEAQSKYDLSPGYCCEDCDGCLQRYKYDNYIRNYYLPNNYISIIEIDLAGLIN